MLSDRIVREINSQIHSELRTVSSWTASEEEKNNALERAAKLKAMLDEPSSSDEATATETYDLADLGRDIRDLIRTIRRS